MKFTKRSSDKLSSFVISKSFACVIAELHDGKGNLDANVYIKSFASELSAKNYFMSLKQYSHDYLSSLIHSDFDVLSRNY